MVSRDGARLLPDFLEHEVLVATLFRLDGIPGDARDFALNGAAIEVGERDAGWSEDGHVAIGEEVDVACVVKNAGDVGGNEGLAFADADDDGRAEARGDDFVRFGGRENAEGECASEALYCAPHGFFQL